MILHVKHTSIGSDTKKKPLRESEKKDVKISRVCLLDAKPSWREGKEIKKNQLPRNTFSANLSPNIEADFTPRSSDQAQHTCRSYRC